jgi:hypothetical protein
MHIQAPQVLTATSGYLHRKGIMVMMMIDDHRSLIMLSVHPPIQGKWTPVTRADRWTGFPFPTRVTRTTKGEQICAEAAGPGGGARETWWTALFPSVSWRYRKETHGLTSDGDVIEKKPRTRRAIGGGGHHAARGSRHASGWHREGGKEGTDSGLKKEALAAASSCYFGACLAAPGLPGADSLYAVHLFPPLYRRCSLIGHQRGVWKAEDARCWSCWRICMWAGGRSSEGPGMRGVGTFK